MEYNIDESGVWVRLDFHWRVLRKYKYLRHYKNLLVYSFYWFINDENTDHQEKN